MTDTDWQPGDPVYADQAPTIRSHCGPCLVAWTAEVDRCPECGELSTEAMRAADKRVRDLCAANISHSEMFPSEPLSPRQVLRALDGIVHRAPDGDLHPDRRVDCAHSVCMLDGET